MCIRDRSYIAIRADKINVSSPVPLAEIKGQLAKEWTSREIAKRLKAKADEISKEASTSGPVSYTHLDVYKRQLFTFINRIGNIDCQS